MSEHYIEKCKHCKAVISQCRCPGPKAVRYSVCEDCKGKEGLNKYILLIMNEKDNPEEIFEFEVDGLKDAERLTHPMMAQEFAEHIQSFILEDMKDE